jgi:hypothetical protein
MLEVREGTLKGGLPYISVGDGPPLVVFVASGSFDANPTGCQRRYEVRWPAPLARGGFTVYGDHRVPLYEEPVVIGTPASFFVDHWALALSAAVVGVALAFFYLVCDYLIGPAWRLRAARRRGPRVVRAFVWRERRRVGQLFAAPSGPLEGEEEACPERRHQ